MNRSSSASVRGRYLAPTLALSFAGLVVGGCVKPERPPQWVLMGTTFAWNERAVYRDGAGCYWLDDDGPHRPLMVGVARDKQWCEPKGSQP